MASGNGNQGRLAKLLEQMTKREEVTPDSFFSDVLMLRQEIAAQRDSTSKAVYRAALAHLLASNAHRSQTYRRKTASHPDSIQEWSQQEYIQHSAALYRQAMHDPTLLHEARTSEWLPLVNRGRDEAVYGGDMLSVVWLALRNDFTPDMRREHQLTGYAEMTDFYRKEYLPEAALRTMLDSIDENYLKPDVRRASLLRLRDEYASEPACALVYLRLSELPLEDAERAGFRMQGDDEAMQDSTQRAQLAWVEEGLARYGSSPYRAELENRRDQLQHPLFAWNYREAYYPDTDVAIPLKARNMRRAELRLYRLPATLDIEGTSQQRLASIRRSGKLLRTFRHQFSAARPEEQVCDTFMLHTPSPGHYVLLMDGEPGIAQAHKDEAPQLMEFYVTALDYFLVGLPDGQLRFCVVDARTGEPQSGVRMNFYPGWRKEGEQRELLTSRTSGENGRVEIAPTWKGQEAVVSLSRDGDDCGRMIGVHRSWVYRPQPQRDSVHHVQLFTDRSIYRPGQTIYVSALTYRQKEWDATTEPRTHKLTCSGPQGARLAEHDIATDELGTMHDSIVLPASAMPGNYIIRYAGADAWVKVEEYKRPTFRIELEDGDFTTDRHQGAGTSKPDTVTIRGRAVTYSDVPVTNARVTGTMYWNPSHWYRRADPFHTPEQIDTLWTDSEGRFTLRLPVKPTAQDMRYGMCVTVEIDVLSPQGETQPARHTMSLSTTPLRLLGTVPAQTDKGRPTPWMLTMYDRMEKPLEGDIACELLTEAGTTAHRFTLSSGKSAVPEGLESLPSGRYRLKAHAEANGDTASYTASIMLFSMDDTRLAVDTTLWVYQPDDTFAPGQPNRIQIGSSLPQAWVHCLATAEDNLIIDTVFCLHDSVFVFEIPYRESYRQGAGISLLTYHEGATQSRRLQLRLQQPDYKLRLHWDTFRSRMRPGDQETWTLSVKQPDGTPARANVMLSLYDASLDAFASHSLRLWISRGYHLKSPDWHHYGAFSLTQYGSLPMSLKWRRTYSFTPSHWEQRYFPTLAMEEMVLYSAASPSTRSVKRMAKNTTVTMAAAVPQSISEDDLKDMGFESADQALNSQIAGLPMEESAAGNAEEAEPEEDADEAPQPLDATMLRTRLNELAFFMPQLRTDETGAVNIAFTLPESLTAWHLTGFAHTRDLMTAGIDETIVAQKELMAELHLPRFLRDGDRAMLTASIRNVSDTLQTGQATWQIMDAESGKILQSSRFAFALAARSDTTYHIPLSATIQHPMLAVRWLAQTADGSDGEERPLPVLSAMQPITETRAFSIRGAQTWKMDLRKLFSFDSPGAVNRRLTVEYTARPMWLALQSLPSLMAPTRKDILSLTSSYYAGSLAAHIARTVPGMQQAVEEWKATGMEESPLTRNQELADMLLQETPWMMEAEQEKARRQRLVTLFESEAQTDRRMTILQAMQALQQADGSFAWYPGMRGNSYLTCSVAYLFTRLRVMTGSDTPDAATQTASHMLARALDFLEKDVAREVAEARKMKHPTISHLGMQYLYLALRSGTSRHGDAARDMKFLLDLLRQDAPEMQGEQRALAAIDLSLAGEKKQARQLMERFHTLLSHPDGTYLAYPSGSFTSIDRKIQRHVQVMEAVALVEPEDTATLQGMQEWLLQQKRTQEWEQPVQTADAVYALMTSPGSSEGVEHLLEKQLSPTGEKAGEVILHDGHKSVALSCPETALGYLRERVDGVKAPRSLTVRKATPGISWGAVYAQYEIPASKAEAQWEGLRIERTVEPGKEAHAIRTGDRIHVRYVVTADRDYEYVRLMAPRPASAEPDTQLSGYRWQGGIGYYRAIHDANSEFFFDRLPRGTYVIEEDWILSHSGTFQLAPATLQCLYAPEYQAHTAGSQMEVKHGAGEVRD